MTNLPNSPTPQPTKQTTKPSGFQQGWAEVSKAEKEISKQYFGRDDVLTLSDPKDSEYQSVIFKTFLNTERNELYIYSSFSDNIDPKNIEIDVSSERLTITAEKTIKTISRSPLTNSMMTKQKFSRVSRSMLLPENSNPDTIKAMWLEEENLLKLIIPME